MASNVTEVQKRISALDEPSKSNWQNWKWDVADAMKMSNVWYDIMEPITPGVYPQAPVPAILAQPTAVETTHIRAFTEKSLQAARWLTTAAGRHNSDICDPLSRTGDAIGIWQRLEARFNPNDTSARIFAFKALYSTKKKSEEKWDEFFMRQDDLATTFKSLFPTTLSATDVIDLLEVINVIEQLPSEHIARSQLLSATLLTPTVVRGAIRQWIATHDGQEPPSVETALAAAGHKCFFCGYDSHVISKCRICQHYQKLWKDDKRNGTGYYANSGNRANGNNSGRGGRGRGRGGAKPWRKNNANAAYEDEDDADTPAFEESAGNASLSLLPSKLSSDRWIADTGASSSMTYHREWVHGMVSDRRAIRLADGNVIFSEGVGYAILIPHAKGRGSDSFRLENVLYVPELRSNLLSVFSLTRNQGFESVINSKSLVFTRKGAPVFSAMLNSNHTAFLDVKTQPITREVTAYSAVADEKADIDRWHDRFAHRSYDTLRRLPGSDAVVGFVLAPSRSGGRRCTSCIEGKLTRAPHTKTAERASEPLGRVFTDLHGPLPVRSREGFEYWAVFVDQHSGHAAIYFLRNKALYFEALKQYKAWSENSMKRKIRKLNDSSIRTAIQILRDDKGGEMSSKELDSFLREHGIQREHTIRDTPQQNGPAERLNRTIAEAVTSMLSHAKLPPSLWADAARAFVYVHNRSPSNSRGFRTPYELWSGSTPSVAHLRVWGCLAYVHQQKDQRSPSSLRAKKCIFLGYAPEQKGYTFYDTEKGGTFVSDSAVFFEDTFPGSLRGRIEHSTLPEPESTPSPPNFRLSAPITAPPPPMPRVSPPPQPRIIRPPPVQPHERPLPPSPPPESSNPDPVVRDTGSSLVVRIPGRHHPKDPKTIRLDAERERPISREVQALTDQTHFGHGFPSENLERGERRARQTNALAAWSEESELELEYEENLQEFAHLADLTASLPADPANHHRGSIPRSSWSKRAPHREATRAWVALVDAVDFALFSGAALEPTSMAEARKRPDGQKWIDAAIEEIKAHLENGTWVLQRLPHGKRAIGSRWVFKVKLNGDGSIERYKGRLVAKGYAQREGVDYTDTFAPTARFAALRTVIALAAIEDWELESVDIRTAFLNGEIDADVYMKIPEGVEIEGVDGDEWVLKLMKGLYGIKQGPRIWSQKLNQVLTKLGFHRLECDHSVFIYEKDGIKIIVPVHVDDLIIASKSKEAVERFKVDLAKHFKIRDLGPTSLILGINLVRDRSKRTIKLSQITYIDSILTQYLPHEVLNGTDVPMADGHLSDKMCPSNPKEVEQMAKIPYREVVGKLLYLAIATRPDIAYAVGVLCRFNSNPGPKHWAAVKHLLRYLKKSRSLHLLYAPNNSTEPFTTNCDADLGGNPDNSRSTAGFVMRVGSGAVMWGSRLQRHVSLSSTESEYTTASAAGCEVMWMRYFFEEIGYDMSKPSTLWMDSNSAIQVAKNPEHVSTMKHVHRSFNWIRERVEEKDLRVGHVPGSDNVADIFTKPLARVKFHLFRDMLGLRE